VVAVISQVNDVVDWKTADEKKMTKREITLIDETGEFTLTVWDHFARRFTGKADDSVIIRKAVRKYWSGGPYLTTTGSFSMQLNPVDDKACLVVGRVMTNRKRMADQMTH
jgi:hypothetical protein